MSLRITFKALSLKFDFSDTDLSHKELKTFLSHYKNKPDLKKIAIDSLHFLHNRRLLNKKTLNLLELNHENIESISTLFLYLEKYNAIKKGYSYERILMNPNFPQVVRFIAKLIKCNCNLDRRLTDDFVKKLVEKLHLSNFVEPLKFLDQTMQEWINTEKIQSTTLKEGEKLTEKLPFSETILTKKSRKQYGDIMSEIILKPQNEKEFSLFIGHKIDDERHTDDDIFKTKLAYFSKDENTNPSFEYHTVNLKNYDPGKIAKRNVKVNQLLHRTAYYGKIKSPVHYGNKLHDAYAKKACFFSEFLPGTSLLNLSKKKLTNISLENRFKWVLSGLQNLQHLHKANHVHGDICFRNMKINFENHTMKLVNFSKSCKNNSMGTQYNFANDMHNMRTVIARIFPELFEISRDRQDNFCINVIIKPSTPQEQVILKLAYDMKKNCSVDDAVNYCEKTMSNVSKLPTPSKS